MAASDDWDISPQLDVPLSLPGVMSFEGFYTREFRMLVALAYALTGSQSHAEDVAQEAMLAAYRRWGEVSALEAPHAWVRRVCANISVSLVRRRLVEARGLLRLGGRRSEVTELDEGASAFFAEVRRLPRRQAQCIVLSYVYGCSVGDVAQVLGCSDATVKTHLARGRSKLAARLGDQIEEGTS